ncbi:hypothetical protein [Ralstonia solanacearum]|uniref:hypothetical protein n=1 Tax=Ralstonia solanacearum TaxID=305 RepID=UPI0005AC4608|nr:hypothetical protein [Ralstonia solanacearum]MDC6177107.1 hypothetical protein [Ralstonia solanacearum]MDC6238361.1 hypothetical protein [Ralstonia solanacearum]
MDQFSRWSGIVHALLVNHVPKIKLGQVHQLLAACLGHRTYASLRTTDLETLNRKPHYVLFDVDAGLARAAELGLAVPESRWREATVALSPSGVTSFWLTSIDGMHSAARLVFEDTFNSRAHAMKHLVGYPDGQRATSSRCHSVHDDVPDILRFDVEGEVFAYNQETSLAAPVIAIVEFPKIGRRMYGNGTLVSAEQHGEPKPRTSDDDDGGEFYWMPEE